jgi:hypothetical protein
MDIDQQPDEKQNELEEEQFYNDDTEDFEAEYEESVQNIPQGPGR